MAETPIWGQHQIERDRIYGWGLGPLRLWCQKRTDELWIASIYDGTDENSTTRPGEPPETVNWSRWAFKREVDKIRLVPIFPELPVVVKPEYPFRVVQGAQARIYVRVPVYVRIDQPGSKIISLTEKPSVVFSRTWFGSFTQGELCYWISSGARREVTADPSRPFLTICPIQISNGSDVALDVEKVALHVERLSIFEKDGQLWSDEMRVEYRGKNEVSRITVSGRAPREVAAAELISPPRNPAKKGFAAKTFATLKDLPGLGSIIS